MPYTRPGAINDGKNPLPSHLQLKPRPQPQDADTPKTYTGQVGDSGSILAKGRLPKQAKVPVKPGDRRVTFNPVPTIDTFTLDSSENGDASDDEQLDTPDGLDSFELSPKETEPVETKHAASDSKQAEEPTEAALALLDTNQSEAQSNRPGLSAQRQKQLAQKAKAEKAE